MKTFITRLRHLDNLVKIQCSPGNYDAHPYMHGLANGLICAQSVMRDQEPVYMDPPKEWGDYTESLIAEGASGMLTGEEYSDLDKELEKLFNQKLNLYYFDCEFYETPGSIQFISIGVVTPGGRKFYAESADFDPEILEQDDWLKANVKPHLTFIGKAKAQFASYDDSLTTVYASNSRIGEKLYEWTGGEDTEPEFWSYYADYDWVVLCWLFGRMVDLPSNYPMFCRDIKQEMGFMGKDPEIPTNLKPTDEHNALADAEYHMNLHDWVKSESVKR